ncbi:MAG: hypothetical protein RML12_11350 [Xanthomonadales bacterium]|nr:hypothetical protein [Xanthomonadales bacterium]
MSGWRSLRLAVDAADGALEAAEAALERCGAVAIGLDGGEEEILEPAPGEILLRGRMALWALLPAELEIERVLLALAAAGARLRPERGEPRHGPRRG